MNELRKKRRVIVVVLVLLGLFIIVGTSYALWQVTLKQTNQNVITTGCFKIDFNDENPINLQEALPITDEVGKALVPYEFTLTNTCNSYAAYQVNLEVLNNTNMENLDYIKIQYEEDNPKLLTSNEVVEKTLNNAKTSYKLETGYLDKNEEVTLHLRLWLDESTPTTEEMMNKIFESKITVITTYEKYFDTEKPIADFQTTKEGNRIIIDASSSEDNTDIKYYYYSKDKENFIKSKDDHYTFIEQEIEYGLAAETLIKREENMIEEVFVKVEDKYGNISDIKSKFVKDMLYDKTVDNNLRYVGTSPNNYVNFNGEKWRIIGIMNNVEDTNGNKDARLKLIRDESIGDYQWDSAVKNVWNSSSIKRELNENYYGTMQSSSKQLIENAKWNLGGCANPGRNILTTSRYYENERGNSQNAIWASQHPVSWNGEVALFYLSDYGYAVGESLDLRESCLKQELKNQETSCLDSNWLYKKDKSLIWSLTPYIEDDVGVFLLDINASRYNLRTYNEYTNVTGSIYPTVYLKENIKIVSGNGTYEDSFELSL